MTHPHSLISHLRRDPPLAVHELVRQDLGDSEGIGTAAKVAEVARRSSEALSTNLSPRDPSTGRTYSVLSAPLLGGAGETLADASRFYIEGNSFNEESKYTEALEQYQKGLVIFERLAPNSRDLANIYDSIGNVYQTVGEKSDDDEKLEQALEQYEKSLAIRESQAPGSLDVAMSYHNIGIICGFLEGTIKELEFHQKSLAIRQKLAPESQAVAESVYSIGGVYETQGEWTFALESYERSFTTFQSLANSDHNTHKINDSFIENCNALARIHDKMGKADLSQGNLHQALESFQRSLAMYQILAPDSLDVARTCTSIGKVYEAQGNLEESLKHHQRSLEIREQAHQRVLETQGKDARPPSDIAHSLNAIGDIYMAQGKSQDAFQSYERAGEILCSEEV